MDSHDAMPSASSSALKGIQVLVVDDEADVRDLLTVMLQNHKAQVTAVSSVQEALTVLHQQQPDLLISDIGMPEEDGLSLIRQLRRAGETLTAIALTAYAREEDRQQALAAGFDAHLAKPINPTELVQVVGSLAPIPA